MKKKRFIPLLAFPIFLMSIALSSVQHEYIGVDKCKMCHKGEKKGLIYETWLGGKHATAIEVLAAEGAKKILTALNVIQPVIARAAMILNGRCG